MTRRAVSRACGHRNTRIGMWRAGAQDWLDNTWCLIEDRIVCQDCGAWLSLGESNDAPDEVQVEMRAAEIAAGLADGGCEVSSLEAHGFNDTVPTLRGGYPVLINTSQQQAGHLAACIADHDRITEHGND
jgi:hypothetical protein